MNICDFQKKVIKHFKSESLKKAIITSNTQFSAIELCKIIFVYVEEYEDRLCLLKEMLSVVSDNDMRSYVEFLINQMIAVLNAIQSNEPGYIHELIVKETPDSYEERYICNSYNSALKCIDEFYNEYGDRENEHSMYEIIKRKIYDCENDSFDEDFYGSCTLNHKRNINKIVFHDSTHQQSTCNGLCGKCSRLCIENIEIMFPSFVEHKELVRYIDIDKRVRYGVNLILDPTFDECCFIIPLDCFALRYNKFDKAFDFHEHIPCPYVEKSDIKEINEELADIYRSFVKYFDENFDIDF